MRIGLKISVCLLAIAALFALVGWRSTIANDALRVQVERLRRKSLQELAGAIDMMMALEETQLATRELLASSWRERWARSGLQPDPLGSAASGVAIADGLVAFEEQLDASRRATDAALAMAEQAGRAGGVAREPREIATWLDRIDDEIAVHHALVRHFLELARSDPEAGSQYLTARLHPHYVDVLQPLIRSYHGAAERELREAVGVMEAVVTGADRDNTLLAWLTFGVAGLLALLTTRTIAQPIAVLRDATDRLYAGDLTVRIPERSSNEFGALAADFNDMADQLQTTAAAKSQVDDILRSIGEIIVVTDMRSRVQTVNRAAVEQLGWSERELVGRDVRDVIRGDGAGDAEMITRSGATLPVVCTPADLQDTAGRPRGRVWVAWDSRRQKQVEEELRQSLAEKDALLREVHHRVKNNLQVISSLLRLQAADASSPQTARLFHESETRIHSMALIHEQLYRSGDHTRVDFRDYVDGLTHNVLASAGEVVRPVKVALDVDPVSLDLDMAIACGLILNELLSNALKYAFPDGRSGTISVTFRCADGTATLVVADDGVGFPAAADGQEPARSLGLRLVTALVRQLHGTSAVDGEGGTRFTLTFPVESRPPAVVMARG
jgi:two-component sensor histidine kinase/HAMP domain-containing protein